MSLNDTTIRELIGFSDAQGVLSFYAGHTPTQAADPQPTAPIEIRNQLRALRQRLADGDREIARAVEHRLGHLDGDLDQLLDPRAPGRGRALFVGVASGETASVALPMPFRERVVLDDGAYVRPLVAALDEGRPAGIVVVSQRRARVLEWSLGEAEVVDEFTFELNDDVQSQDKSGPSPSGPGQTHRGHVDRDRFEDRVDENRHRFLRQVADAVHQRAEAAAWDRVVLSASPKLRDVTRELLVGSGQIARVLVAEPAWDDATPHDIALQAWDLLRSVHRDRERELVATAEERALGGGAGALGLRQVCAALNEGRVAHLLYDQELDLGGYVTDEGTLHPQVEGLVAESDATFHHDTLFVERLLERAITTSAAVTPIAPEQAQPLAGHDGVAALLRW